MGVLNAVFLLSAWKRFLENLCHFAEIKPYGEGG
jgi:hypothetical protein